MGFHASASRVEMKETKMAKTYQAPRFVRLANVMTKNLLRAGVKLRGYGNPMYLLTVRGRKSGQPRTIPVVIVEQDGNRYLFSPFGIVDWVRNLRAAGEAILTRGRRAEHVRASELPTDEAGLVLRGFITSGKNPPIIGYFGVTTDSSLEDFVRATAIHPVFLIERK
jgi:deazaflavin-dependent oxidoreductase (nitroreductase family)